MAARLSCDVDTLTSGHGHSLEAYGQLRPEHTWAEAGEMLGPDMHQPSRPT